MLRSVTVVVIVAMVLMIGCAAHTHKIGHGAVLNHLTGGGTTVTERQWYLLYGLVPINEIDTQAMAKGRRNYEITTQVTVEDFIYGILFYPLTIRSRTVKVRN